MLECLLEELRVWREEPPAFLEVIGVARAACAVAAAR